MFIILATCFLVNGVNVCVEPETCQDAADLDDESCWNDASEEEENEDVYAIIETL